MDNHVRQTAVAFFAVSAVATTLFFSFRGNVDTLAAPTETPRESKGEYFGITPALPDIITRDRFALLTTTTGVVDTESSLGFSRRTPYVITSVVDGNTLIADGSTRIRLAGIKAPEQDEELGLAATDFLKKLIEGKEILFEPDTRNPSDTFGRLRGIVYVGQTNANIEMLKNGLAQVYPVYPSSIDTDNWQTYADLARQAQKGLWGDVTESPDPYNSDELFSPVSQE